MRSHLSIFLIVLIIGVFGLEGNVIVTKEPKCRLAVRYPFSINRAAALLSPAKNRQASSITTIFG